MSIHRSLHTAGALEKHRNVLTREERIDKMAGEERWTEEKNSVLGLPKWKNIKVRAKKKTKKVEAKEEGVAAEAAGAAAAEPKAEKTK